MNKFKVGDRVAVYSWLNKRVTGTVRDITSAEVFVEYDTPLPRAIRSSGSEMHVVKGGTKAWSLYQQCRKLKPAKKARRVFIREQDLDPKILCSRAVIATPNRAVGEDVEFVEVRKKKVS